MRTEMNVVEGMLAVMILMMAAMGTARTIPGKPQSQPQKTSEKMTTSGLNPKP
jgi:hypothetical protein